MSTHCLEFVQLSCARGDRTLFEGLNARVAPGGLLYVAGTNGSGKTTLLRTICGLGRPAAGKILWNGESTRGLGDEYRRCISFVGHLDGVQGELTPIENLRAQRCVSQSHQLSALQPLLSGKPINRTDNNDYLVDILDRLGLAAYRSFPAKILSQGQRRRLGLARLLVADKPLWILDEPFTALDVRSCQLISDLLGQHLSRGGMAVISSHQEFAIAGIAPSRIDLDSLRTPSPHQWAGAGSMQPASARHSSV